MNSVEVGSTTAPPFPLRLIAHQPRTAFHARDQAFKTHFVCLCLSYSPLNYRWAHSWGGKDRMQRADDEGYTRETGMGVVTRPMSWSERTARPGARGEDMN